jgi:hypothetical protein
VPRQSGAQISRFVRSMWSQWRLYAYVDDLKFEVLLLLFTAGPELWHV